MTALPYRKLRNSELRIENYELRIQVTRNVIDDGGMPESDAIQTSPAAIGSEVVSVPVVMTSPA